MSINRYTVFRTDDFMAVVFKPRITRRNTQHIQFYTTGRFNANVKKTNVPHVPEPSCCCCQTTDTL